MKEILKGLTSEEATASRNQHGSNALRREKKKSLLRRFAENLSDPIIKVLVIALAVEVVFTFGNCNLFEVFGILLAILISTTVSTLSEYGSERAFEKMQADGLGIKANVIRDGKSVKIPTDELVVGDIMQVTAGESIQADGRILSGSLTVNQSTLNGESIDVTKSAESNGESGLSSACHVFRGTTVSAGSATVKVERVGESTYYGGVATDVQTDTRESPLKRRLSGLASDISNIGYVMAALVGVTYLFNAYAVANHFDGAAILLSLRNYRELIANLLHTLTLMITVVVVAVPEGLPMMITVVLSANMKKMLADNILIKKLVGIETAGSMNLLFTDKTGTITEGKISCSEIITADGSYTSLRALKSDPAYKNLLLSAKYNTECTASSGEITGGNATDRAIYSFFLGESIYADVRDKEAFSSERKYSSVTFKNGKKLIKGAAENILSKSSYVYDADGNAILYDLSKIESHYQKAVMSGERAIAVAAVEGGKFVFVALIILKDKIRRGVKEAVAEVTSAGIQTVMLTGDGKETASSIATECGILRRGGLVLTSEELSRMTDDEVKSALPRLRVLARALPKDKTRLVRLAQEMDLVVGMTGDGVNDAPSLKLADVGFAMGSGTDIAKAAGDVVILDNSFSAISKSILYGRTIFKSIRKFITFQLIMNFAACGISLIGQFLGIENPITIIQMLWVNIIMDTLGGLAFAGEAPMRYYMKEKPKRRDEKILTGAMLGQIILSGAYVLLLCTLFLIMPAFAGRYRGEAEHLTAFYALFIFSGIFSCFSARSERLWLFSGIGKNRAFSLIMLLITAVQIAMIYFGGEMFRSVPLTLRELSLAFSLAATVIPFDILRRIISRLS